MVQVKTEKWSWPKGHITTLLKNVEQMTPRAKALTVVKACQMLCDSIGVRFLSDMKVFWLSYCAGTMVVIYLSLAIYTLSYHTNQHNFSKGIKSTCVIGIAVPSCLLYFNTINANRYRYRKVIMFATDYIYMDKKDNSQPGQLCEEYGMRSIKISIFFIIFILMSTGQAMTGSAIEFHKTGQLVSFLALKLPYIDEDDVLGFHLNLALQTTITAFGTVGNLAIETTACIKNSTVLLCSEIISFDCKELTEKLELNLQPKIKILAELRNIFVKFQDLDRFILNMSYLYYWRLFAAPVLITYSVSISVFCQYALDFPCGYGFAILSYSQLLIICYMGNNVLQANNRVMHAFSNLPWYLLPLRTQKNIGHILRRTQHGPVLTIGPFAELNYETATNLTSTIYRILMVCMNFVAD